MFLPLLGITIGIPLPNSLQSHGKAIKKLHFCTWLFMVLHVFRCSLSLVCQSHSLSPVKAGDSFKTHTAFVSGTRLRKQACTFLRSGRKQTLATASKKRGERELRGLSEQQTAVQSWLAPCPGGVCIIRHRPSLTRKIRALRAREDLKLLRLHSDFT